METFIGFGVEVLRLVPFILAFHVPALVGVVLLKERGDGYKARAALVFLAGFGGLVALQLLLRSVSTLQVAQTLVLSLIEIVAALFLAILTVYKLAD